jgi:hypothetical protein
MRSAAVERVAGAAVDGSVVISGNPKHLSHHADISLISRYLPIGITLRLPVALCFDFIRSTYLIINSESTAPICSSPKR